MSAVFAAVDALPDPLPCGGYYFLWRDDCFGKSYGCSELDDLAVCEGAGADSWRVLGQLRYAGLPSLPAGDAAVELVIWDESPQAIRLVAEVSGRKYETRIPLT